VLWSGFLYSICSFQSLLASRINWIWFMASQIAFASVAASSSCGRSVSQLGENLPSLYARELKLPE